MTKNQNFQSEGVRLGLTPRSAPEDGNSVFRGYIKLSDAVKAFHFDFRGKTVLDIGSSTGGFTKYALDHGAKKVIAIEKGTNQMAKPLRYDKRIDLHEKTDVFNVGIQNSSTRGNPEAGKPRTSTGHPWRRAGRTRPEMELFCTPDVIVADVSFISLKKVLSHAKKYLSDEQTEFLVMLKPQFEATPAQLNRGIVKNEKIRRDIIKHFELWLKANDFVILAKRDNELKGKNGNIERFYHLKLAK